MTEEAGEIVDLWVGSFPSRKRLERYFDEHYDDDRAPFSEFAADQGEEFYDHDFLEYSISKTPTGDIGELLRKHSFAEHHVAEAERQYREMALPPVNSVVLLSRSEVSNPVSTKGSDYVLHYLGRFIVESEPIQRPTVAIPQRVNLRVKSPIEIDGKKVRKLEIDERGLSIGVGGADSEERYVDLSKTPGCEHVAIVQTSIYRDKFGQWTVEDRGLNGLTRVGGQTLRGERSLPWDGMEIGVGSVVFVWEVPEDE